MRMAWCWRRCLQFFSFCNPGRIPAMNIREARFRGSAAAIPGEQLVLDCSSLLQRTAVVAAIAAADAETVDREARFPQGGHRRRHGQQKLLGVQMPREFGGERRLDLRRHRHVLRARPRLRLDGDDLRHAPDQGRLRGPPRRRQLLARNLHAPRRRRAAAAGVLDHRRPERRQRPLQRGADRARRRRDLARRATPP